MLQSSIIITIYEQLFSQATLRSAFHYKVTKADLKLIEKFIAWINKQYKEYQINEELIIGYFEFQFSRYSGVITPVGKNAILLNWLIGPKAIKEWNERNTNKKQYIKWKCNKDFKLSISRAFQRPVKVNTIPFVESVNEYEENEKQRFYNKKEGYVYCGQFTTLYNPNSKLCQQCKFNKICIERLRLNFENLYKKRIQYEPATI